MSEPDPIAAGFTSCPVPLAHRTEVTVGHGGGGKLTQQLIDRVFRPAFAHPALEAQHDGALLQLPAGGGRLAFTTDGHVVSPLFFPGGDIGHLAVNGTVNDLCMCGARPLWLSAGFIIEEGFPIATLERIVASMKSAAQAAGEISSLAIGSGRAAKEEEREKGKEIATEMEISLRVEIMGRSLFERPRPVTFSQSMAELEPNPPGLLAFQLQA